MKRTDKENTEINLKIFVHNTKGVFNGLHSFMIFIEELGVDKIEYSEMCEYLDEIDQTVLSISEKVREVKRYLKNING